MVKKKLNVQWIKTANDMNIKPALDRYKRYLVDKGFRKSTVDSYVSRIGKYLRDIGSTSPSEEDFANFRNSLHERDLSKSTINNYSFAIKNYHEMIGKSISFSFMKKNDHIPYYFDQEEVLRVFDACHNIKHLAMLKILFYGCLRASELCNLDDADLDLKSLSIRVREGKGGKDGLIYITDDCARTLARYLKARPPLEVDGRRPLFYTDFGNRWDRRDIYRMFIYYKKKAGIEKRGGVHVFARHTPATIMVANGCDIRIVKEVLRHEDIRTTLRYAHVSDKTIKESHQRCLTI